MELKCYFIEFQYSFFGDHYTCKSHGFTTTIDDRIITKIYGTHLLTRSSNDVEQLYIRGQDCEFVPRGISKHFPNLQSLSMPHSKIKNLFNDDLSDLKKLKSVDFAYSKITRLDSNFFMSSKEIEIISFRRSYGLEIVGQLAFSSLKKLKTLQLLETKCINSETINNRTEVKQLVMKVRLGCQDPQEKLIEAEVEDETTERNILSELNVNAEHQLRILKLENELLGAQKLIKRLTDSLKLKCEPCNCVK